MIGIFGGSGFIGRNFLDKLSESKLGYINFDRIIAKGHEDHSIVIDYKDPSTYLKYLPRLSKVVMLISASGPSTFSQNISLEIENNVWPFSQLLNALSHEAEIGKIIYLSSGGTVYGIPKTDPILENHSTQPISNYGCGKLLMEDMLLSMSHQNQWKYSILRPSNPIGRFQKPGGQGLVAVAVDCALNDKHLTIWGDGGIIRDYFDVQDLADAIYLSLDPTIESGRFNVGSNIGRSIVDIVEIVSETLKKEIHIEHVQARRVDIPKNILSYGKLNDMCGWKPVRDIRDSIQDIARGL